MMKIGLDRGSPGGYEKAARAAACISVDFDVTRPGREVPNKLGTKALLGLSEKYEIPLTWAICGKTAEADRESYESILESTVKQEIGIHTYSHIYADEVSEDVYRDDINKCLAVLGLSSAPDTFVFPKNREGYFALLKRMGFRCYRGQLRVIGKPTGENGLWNIRPVYYFDQKSLGAQSVIERFIDVCIARRAVFHLWTHPWSISIEGKPDEMVKTTLEPVFSYLREKKQSGLLSPTTMGRLSSFLSLGAAS
jgi:peptidoglycan/xylan/chitin deacetylase (PgdA/CDA1 family)